MFPPTLLPTNRHLLAVHPDFSAVLTDPLGGGVGLVDGGRILGLRGRRVIGKHRRGTRPDHEIAHQPLMCREVAEHPAAAMEEHENREGSACPGRLYPGRLYNVKL
jgi:hypothetical protein